MLASAVVACCSMAVTIASAESISLKFGDDGTNGDGSLVFGEGGSTTQFFGNTEIGMESVAGADWIMCSVAPMEGVTGEGFQTILSNGASVQVTGLCDWYSGGTNDFFDKWNVRRKNHSVR